MNKAVMGAAVAAVMGCAGVVQAAPLVIDFTIDGSNLQMFETPPFGITAADFPASGSAVLDLTSADVVVQDFSLTIGGTTFDESVFSEARAYTSGNSGVTGFSVLAPFNPNFPEEVYAVDLDLQPQQPGITSGFEIGIATGAVFCSKCITSTISYSVHPVPLPSSASLFGSVLLALGGIGYASRRSKAKAA